MEDNPTGALQDLEALVLLLLLLLRHTDAGEEAQAGHAVASSRSWQC